MNTRILSFLVLFSCSGLFTNAQTTLHFSGLDWAVRGGSGGPGPNTWSDDPQSVWVDTSGYLHMKIRKSGDAWFCSEVSLQKSYGYGEYWFEILSDVEQYDQKIVVGLFTYETDAKEIDIEFSRWDDPGSVAGWYTVQPYPYTVFNQSGFVPGLNGSPSTHLFNWQADSIKFQSFKPFTITVPPMDSLIYQWTYTGNHNPPAGNERLHLNFWLFQGVSPVNQQEAELLIRSVRVPGQSSGINNDNKNEDVLIFPNPARDLVRVESTGTMDISVISVYNSVGQLIERRELNSKQLEIGLSLYKNGFYFLRLETTSGNRAARFVVQK